MAIQFNTGGQASGDYLYTMSSELAATGNFSVRCWLKYVTAVGGTGVVPMGYLGTGTGAHLAWMFNRPEGSSNVTFRIAAPGAEDYSDTILSTGTWYDFRLTYNASTRVMSLYLGSATLEAQVTGTEAVTNTMEILGQYADSVQTGAYDVCYFREWTAILTSGEFDSEAASATAVKTASLWRDCPFPSTSDYGDDSGLSNEWDAANGTIANADDYPLGGGSSAKSYGRVSRGMSLGMMQKLARRIN